MIQNQKIDLTTIVLTRDEEKDIKDCLESVKDLAQELIIVDSYSTDKTLEIARQFNAKIYQRHLDNFGKQRNFALSKAKNDWVLSLDADERLTEGLKKEIKKALNSKYNGFYIPFKNYFLGKWIKHSGWYPQYKLRLFRKSKMSFDEAKLHEKVKEMGKIGYLKNPILHYSYSDIKECFRKLEKYSSFQADPSLTPFDKFNFLRMLAKPPYRFLKMYFIQLGFLDGWQGLFLALLTSYHEFKVHLKVRRKMWQRSQLLF
jgi:glycosyltransferase involved in cell wall biosynthesis